MEERTWETLLKSGRTTQKGCVGNKLLRKGYKRE